MPLSMKLWEVADHKLMGYWFVNAGEGEHRDWDDSVAYGYIAAGQDEKFLRPLKKLEEVEKKIETILADAKGQPRIEPFEGVEDEDDDLGDQTV